ncbi:MAG: phage antirepressor KilAC domain-containing protein [Peptococcaceae bacterium]|jgi:anti-repressor protein|nr:phage antirepressor KilAC domain-containing protein [Peptococcaceae bacterium]MBQ2448860.1 phage antirepressor KilAC domain-containing protein [Peptococcaceae bacterium]MBQ5703306.1 phage antirepressor KilAC domain-containing protein [Peptococcaceae bacterium]
MEQIQTVNGDNSVHYINLAALAVEELKKERELRMEAEHKMADYQNKALFADAVTASRESILVADMALILKQEGVEIGRDRLFEWLRGNGYLYRKEYGHNRPTQKSLEMGILELAETAIVNAYGRVTVTRTVKITQKGKEYFLKVITAQKEIINAQELEKKKESQKKQNERRKEKQLARRDDR